MSLRVNFDRLCGRLKQKCAFLAGEDGVEVVPLELGQPELVGDPALGDLLGEAVQQGVVAPPRHLGTGVTCRGCKS